MKQLNGEVKLPDEKEAEISDLNKFAKNSQENKALNERIEGRGEISEVLDFLNGTRKSGKEAELYRDLMTGRKSKLPKALQEVSGLEERFSIGKSHDEANYLSEHSAAHDLIDYLAQ